jgi:GDSL-like Lipase/Acylhydrolase
MGCLPLLLTIFKSHHYHSYDHTTGCIKRFNSLSRYHNNLLIAAVQELRVKYSHAMIIYADYYNPVTNFVRFPQRYGKLQN